MNFFIMRFMKARFMSSVMGSVVGWEGCCIGIGMGTYWVLPRAGAALVYGLEEADPEVPVFCWMVFISFWNRSTFMASMSLAPLSKAWTAR